MLEILADRTYRHLFFAQVVALLGTGLATVALGLLAYDLAGDGAAMVLGTVFTIKMVAYVGIAPIAGAFADRVNRRVLLVGLGYSAVLTPSGRLLRRSAHAEDRPALFAAQFALSHACWLVTYPLSGWLMTQFGPVAALVGLAAVASAGALTALRLWPKEDPEFVEHTHDNLPVDHPHLKGERRHAHPFVVDDQHPRWASHL